MWNLSFQDITKLTPVSISKRCGVINANLSVCAIWSQWKTLQHSCIQKNATTNLIMSSQLETILLETTLTFAQKICITFSGKYYKLLLSFIAIGAHQCWSTTFLFLLHHRWSGDDGFNDSYNFFLSQSDLHPNRDSFWHCVQQMAKSPAAQPV